MLRVVVADCSSLFLLPKMSGPPNSAIHPIVADGTISVKGRISSIKLTYFKLGDVASYMAMIKTVWIGAHATSANSPAAGIKYDADPNKSMSKETTSRPQRVVGRMCHATLTGVGRGPVSYTNV